MRTFKGVAASGDAGSEETNVRRAEVRQARAESGHVNGVEAFERDESRRERVRHTGCDQTPWV